jgi:glycogen operon protein
LNWLSWDEHALYVDELQTFVSRLTELRKRFPMLTHDRFIHKDDNDSSVDITWFHPSGFAMQKEQWHCHHASTLGYLITEKPLIKLTDNSTQTTENIPAILSLVHAGPEPLEFQLPDIDTIDYWQVMVDTTASNEQVEIRKIPAERKVTMMPFSTIVLLNDCL